MLYICREEEGARKRKIYGVFELRRGGGVGEIYDVNYSNRG